MLLGGRATDLLGRRRVFLAGLLVFTSASLASGLAWSPAALVVARAIQGLGAALLVPAASRSSRPPTTEPSAPRPSPSGARSAAPAPRRACCSAASSPRCSVGSGSSSSTFPSGWPSPRGRCGSCPPCPRAARRAPRPAGALAVMAGLVALVYALDGAAQHGWTSARTLVAARARGRAAGRVRRGRARRPRPAAAAGDLAVALAGGGRRGHAVGDGHPGRRVLPEHALPAAGPRRLGARDRAGLPAADAGHRARGATSRRILLARLGSRVVVAAGAGLMAGGALLLAGAPEQASYCRICCPVTWSSGSASV